MCSYCSPYDIVHCSECIYQGFTYKWKAIIHFLSETPMKLKCPSDEVILAMTGCPLIGGTTITVALIYNRTWATGAAQV
jgi:hypothetical protein